MLYYNNRFIDDCLENCGRVTYWDFNHTRQRKTLGETMYKWGVNKYDILGSNLSKCNLVKNYSRNLFKKYGL